MYNSSIFQLRPIIAHIFGAAHPTFLFRYFFESQMKFSWGKFALIVLFRQFLNLRVISMNFGSLRTNYQITSNTQLDHYFSLPCVFISIRCNFHLYIFQVFCFLCLCVLRQFELPYDGWNQVCKMTQPCSFFGHKQPTTATGHIDVPIP